MKKQAGFTLIEVILAMAITAFVAMLGYSALSTAMNTAEQHEKKANQLADIQLALSVLERDIRNAVIRGIKDEYGDEQSAMMGGVLADYPLQLTRRGWDNPTEVKRGELQRLRYEYSESKLWRENWLILDRISEEEGKQRVMVIDQLESFELAFLSPSASGAGSSAIGGVWQDEWDDNSLPLAIEVRLEIENFGQVKRVFEIPTQ